VRGEAVNRVERKERGKARVGRREVCSEGDFSEGM
jgi:hypothetical protein